MSNFQNLELFAISVGFLESEDFSYRDDLIKALYEIKAGMKSEVVSNVGGWQSHPDVFADERLQPFFQPIWNHIEQAVCNYAQNKKLAALKGRLNLSDMWVNINPPGAFNHVHVHPGSLLSGILWLKVPEGSGNIKFHDPNEMNNYCLIENGNTCYGFLPKEGVMALFPSFLNHNVDLNMSDEDRISIAFNLDVR